MIYIREKVKKVIELILRGNISEAREIAKGLDGGYRMALLSIVSSIERGDRYALVNRIMSGEVTKDIILKEIRDSTARSKQRFRPEYEREYEEAWSYVLESLLSVLEEDS